MESTDSFKKAIRQHLEYRGFTEPLFRKKLENPKKNLDDCVTYILNTVQKSGKAGFTDDEVFNMAAHYYDEDDIEVGNKIDGKVVVNHQIKLTDEEIKKAKEKALQEAIEAEKQRLTKNKKKAVVDKKEKPEQQNTLF